MRVTLFLFSDFPALHCLYKCYFYREINNKLKLRIFKIQLLFLGKSKRGRRPVSKFLRKQLLRSFCKYIRFGVSYTNVSVVLIITAFWSIFFNQFQNHPEVVEAAREGLKNYGAGLSSVRFICGTQTIHKVISIFLLSYNQIWFLEITEVIILTFLSNFVNRN